MTEPETTSGHGFPVRIAIVVVIVAVFAAIVAMKLMPAAGDTEQSAQTAQGATAPVAGKLSESHADATAAYAAAQANGKPTYVLFHSLTCQSCVEISAVVDRVLPGYADKVVFVNAISDDPGSQQLLSKFKFQYIPTSFFIDGKGKVVSSFTGVLNDAEMKARLDKLLAAQ